MKRFIIWISCFMVLTGCMRQETEAFRLDKKEALSDFENQIGREVSIEQEIYVYRTKTGTKYHRYGCRYLRSSCEEMNLRDVKRLGLKACSVCRPPLLASFQQVVNRPLKVVSSSVVLNTLWVSRQTRYKRNGKRFA